MGPSVSYDELVTALEGRRKLSAWHQLAELLEERPGWQFGLSTDGLMILWRLAGRWVWIIPDVQRQRGLWRTVFTVYRGGRSSDDVTWWECAQADELLALLELLEVGQRPIGGCTPKIVVHGTGSAG